MYNITGTGDLRKAIRYLEEELEGQKHLLSEEITLIYKINSPLNIIRNLFREISSSDGFRAKILTATLGISTGYIARKLFPGKRRGLLKIITGYLFQYGIASIIMNPRKVWETHILPLIAAFTRTRNPHK